MSSTVNVTSLGVSSNMPGESATFCVPKHTTFTAAA
jgi:hypothetical protein